MALWDEEGIYGCCYCGGEFIADNPLEVDHVIPRSKGGADVVSNCAPACRLCNNAKSDGDPLPFWLEAMTARGLDPERLLKNLELIHQQPAVSGA